MKMISVISSLLLLTSCGALPSFQSSDESAPSSSVRSVENDPSELSRLVPEGKKAVVYFWNTTVQGYADDLRFLSSFDSSPVSVVAVATDERIASVAAIAKEGRYAFPMLLDNEGILRDRYRIEEPGVFLLIDSTGRINHAYRNDVRYQDIDSALSILP